MPRAPITPSIVAGPVGRGTYSAQDVAQVQPQQPGMLVQQGQQLQRLGGALEDVAEVQRIKQARALATESDAKFSESLRTSRSEFGKLQGRKAVDAFPEYEKSIRESAKKLLDGVTDPLAQRLIRESAEQRIRHNLNEAAVYRDKQQETWLDGAEKASITEAAESYKAGVRDGDPDADRFFVTALNQQRQMDERKGLSPEQRRINELATTTMLHGSVVEGFIERGEGIKAFQYIETNKKEMAADFYAKQQPQAKAAFIEQGARKIDETLPTFTEKLQAVQQMQGASDEDKASAIRHLRQFEAERDQTQAIEARDVRQQAEQFYREHPELTEAEMPPKLRESIQRLGVVVKRVPVTDDAWVQANLRDARKLAQLRELTPEQRENFLAPHLSESDLKKELAFIDGDQLAYSEAEMFDRAAAALGVPISTAGQGEAFKIEAAQARMRFDAMMNREIELLRAKKGDDLSLDEIQSKIIDPMLMARNTVARGEYSIERMPLAGAQVRGIMPTNIDDPATTNIDESMSFENAGDFYVETPTGKVYLRDITLEQRRKIAYAWAADNQGKQMTLQDEVNDWVRLYKPSVDAKKAADQATRDAEQLLLERRRASGAVFGPK